MEPDNITDNMLCISTRNENTWERATVVNKNGASGPLLQFIDSGISAEVAIDKVFELPEELQLIPPQAVECSLVVDGIEDHDVEEFKNEVLDKDVIIKVEDVDSERLKVIVYSNKGIVNKLLMEKTDEPKEIDVICPMPVYKKLDRVIISHAESNAIFIQRVSTIETLKELLGELYEWCETIAPTDTEWKVDNLCCTKSLADDQWYRAKLLTVEPEFNVKYLDYGNSEIVTADRLRKLELSYFKPEAFALEVKMAVNWQVSEEHLLELFPDKEFNATIKKWQNCWYVELIDDNNENVSNKLVELGFATEIENSPFVKKISSFSKLFVGAHFGVCRSHISSPSQFWVILNEDFEDLEHLQDRLQNSVSAMKNISSAPPKTMVAAKFSDGIWYRAIYLQTEKAVFSVDYGNTEPYDGEQLKELSEDFLSPEGYAILCSLNIEPVEEVWNDEVLEFFETLIPDDVINAHILKIDKTVTVELKVNDESVSKALIDKGYAVKSIITSSVYISHVNSPEDFYIQEENPLLDQIRGHLTLANNFNTIEDIEKHSQKIFAAQYHVDGLWYRAKLLSSDENGHNVLFVDYGNSDVATEFKQLPTELLEIPFMARNCSLKLPESIEMWSEEASEKFIELVADGSMLFDIKFLSDDEPIVVELSLNGQVVNDLLCHTDDNLSEHLEKVAVSHINNPLDFFIQLENAPLNELANYFVDVENWALINVEDVNPGSLVAAFFDEDFQWYRAKVVNKVEDGADVLFIDYGNCSKSKELRQLPEDLAQLPPAAKHCRLELSNDSLEWPAAVIDHFKELTGNGSLTMDVKYISSEEPFVVKLLIGDEDVATKLTEFCTNMNGFHESNEASGNNELAPTELVCNDINESNEVSGINKCEQAAFVCHINTPSDFYIHIDKIKADKMVNDLMDGESFEAVSDVTPGLLVAARFEDDGQWYRASITKVEEDSFVVFFVDYGNSAVVTELKTLPKHLSDIPYLAQLCCLQPADGGIDWSDSATDKFFEICADGVTEFTVKTICDDVPLVIELFLNGLPVSQMLSENSDLNQGVITCESECIEESNQTEPKTSELEGFEKAESQPEQNELNDDLVEDIEPVGDFTSIKEGELADKVEMQSDRNDLTDDLLGDTKPAGDSTSAEESNAAETAESQSKQNELNDDLLEDIKPSKDSIPPKEEKLFSEKENVKLVEETNKLVETEYEELNNEKIEEDHSENKANTDNKISPNLDTDLSSSISDEDNSKRKENVNVEKTNIPNIVNDVSKEICNKEEIQFDNDVIKKDNVEIDPNEGSTCKDNSNEKIEVESVIINDDLDKNNSEHNTETVHSENDILQDSLCSENTMIDFDSDNKNVSQEIKSPDKVEANVSSDSVSFEVAVSDLEFVAKNNLTQLDSQPVDVASKESYVVEGSIKTEEEQSENLSNNCSDRSVNDSNKTDVTFTKVPLSEKIVPGAVSQGTLLEGNNKEQ